MIIGHYDFLASFTKLLERATSVDRHPTDSLFQKHLLDFLMKTICTSFIEPLVAAIETMRNLICRCTIDSYQELMNDTAESLELSRGKAMIDLLMDKVGDQHSKTVIQPILQLFMEICEYESSGHREASYYSGRMADEHLETLPATKHICLHRNLDNLTSLESHADPAVVELYHELADKYLVHDA